MPFLPRPQPLIVVILDGWGISFVERGNAIAAAKTPYMDLFARHFPTASLHAAGIEVGLPWGEVGNSETGHSNIGAGTIHYQSLPRINKAIADKSFFTNRVLLDAITHVKQHQSNLHLMGLVSSGGVHAHLDHLIALLQLTAREKLYDHVFIHMFTDGRDTPPQSALIYLQQLEAAMDKHKIGRIASMTGRLYAMDRNENWERTRATFDLLTGGLREYGASSPRQAIEQAYQQKIYDEMLPPTAITQGGESIAVIKPNDAVIFFNYRPDRARQLTRAFADPAFNAFPRTVPENLFFATMEQYDPTLPVPAAFIEAAVEMPLARIVSQEKLTQLHIAESEKYAHITYYLNGGHEEPFPQEDHILIPSATIKNFAELPQMAAREITDHVLTELERAYYDIYFINFANADMVGHTGNFEATVTACAFVDTCLGRLYEYIMQLPNAAMLVTADHGNAEDKIHPETGEIETDHTNNPVPIHYLKRELARTTPRSTEELNTILATPIGVLSDVAPTILDILQLPTSPNMTGLSLLTSLQ